MLQKTDRSCDRTVVAPVKWRYKVQGLTPNVDVSSIFLLQPKSARLPASRYGGTKVRIENPDGANGNANHCQGHF